MWWYIQIYKVKKYELYFHYLSAIISLLSHLPELLCLSNLLFSEVILLFLAKVHSKKKKQVRNGN